MDDDSLLTMKTEGNNIILYCNHFSINAVYFFYQQFLKLHSVHMAKKINQSLLQKVFHLFLPQFLLLILYVFPSTKVSESYILRNRQRKNMIMSEWFWANFQIKIYVIFSCVDSKSTVKFGTVDHIFQLLNYIHILRKFRVTLIEQIFTNAKLNTEIFQHHFMDGCAL